MRHRILAAILAGTVAYGQIASAGATQLRDVCDLHLEMVFASPGTNHVAGAQFNSVPPEAMSVASHANENVATTIYQIPRNDAQYSAVFAGEHKTLTLTRAQTVEMDAATRFLTAKAVNPVTADIVDFDHFRKMLKMTPGRYMIFVGHNDDGQLAFLSGQREDLSLLEKACEVANKKCIFISCRSKDYLTAGTAAGVERDLTMKESIEIAESIRNFISIHAGPVSDLQIAAFIQKAEHRAYVKYHVTYLVLKGCTVIVGAIVVALVIQSITCNSDKSDSC